MRVITLIALIGVAAARENQDVVDLVKQEVKPEQIILDSDSDDDDSDDDDSDDDSDSDWWAEDEAAAVTNLDDAGDTDENEDSSEIFVGPWGWIVGILGGGAVAGAVGKKVYDDKKKEEGEKEGGSKEVKKLFKSQIGKKHQKKAVK